MLFQTYFSLSTLDRKEINADPKEWQLLLSQKKADISAVLLLHPSSVAQEPKSWIGRSTKISAETVWHNAPVTTHNLARHNNQELMKTVTLKK